MTDLTEWRFGYGGWDGSVEAICTRCRTEIPFTEDLTVGALVDAINTHTCQERP